MPYDVIIGLEIHAELKTKSKMFCSCDNNSINCPPNTNTCPICMGHPGTLPTANQQAIEWTILAGMALHCRVNLRSKFDRKNYFYPDLPKGYQISQYDLPLVYGGYLDIGDKKIAITRIHLEEDTGKSIHPQGKNYTLIDFNRAGTPLMELVTEPVISSAADAKKFCQLYRNNLRYLNISDADMEKGEMRCEANVSLQAKGSYVYEDGEIKAAGQKTINPKVELKNINSFRAIEKAIEYEIKRQEKILNDNGAILQETRGWDENTGKTFSQRVKETSADYRYFPEPDIPSMEFNDATLESIKSRLIEMPSEKNKRFREEYKFSEEYSLILTADKELANYTENCISELRAWVNSTGDNWERQGRQLAKTTANWLISELLKHLNKDNKRISDIRITPENFAELISLVYLGKINSSAAQSLLKTMYEKGGEPKTLMVEMGLEQIDDSAELDQVINKVIMENPAQINDYLNGKENVIQFLVGKTMSATGGKANPKLVNDILQEKLIKTKRSI